MKGKQTLNEQRRIKRHHLPYYLQVHNRVTGKIVGYIVNISHKGMMLVSKNPILVHAIFELQIRLPSPINDRSIINFDALSHWCHPDVTPGCFDTGFSFSEPPDELKELVDKISEYFTFNITKEEGEQ